MPYAGLYIMGDGGGEGM